MARISDELNNVTKLSLSEMDSGMAIKDFPGKYNNDINALKNKINELVDLINNQNEVIRNLENRLISTVNNAISEYTNRFNQLDDKYVKKTNQ